VIAGETGEKKRPIKTREQKRNQEKEKEARAAVKEGEEDGPKKDTTVFDTNKAGLPQTAPKVGGEEGKKTSLFLLWRRQKGTQKIGGGKRDREREELKDPRAQCGHGNKSEYGRPKNTETRGTGGWLTPKGLQEGVIYHYTWSPKKSR